MRWQRQTEENYVHVLGLWLVRIAWALALGIFIQNVTFWDEEHEYAAIYILGYAIYF